MFSNWKLGNAPVLNLIFFLCFGVGFALSLGSEANAQALTGKKLSKSAEEFMLDVLQSAKEPSARISSTTRTVSKQASVMYGLIKKKGVSSAYKLYGSMGDAVIGVYEKNSEKEKSEVINLMESEILRQIDGKPNRRQLMHIQPVSNITFDVAPSSIKSSRFEQQLRGNPEVARFFAPKEAESAYHIELPKSLETISGMWSGSCSNGNENVAMRLKLSRGDSGYTGSIRSDNDSWRLSSARVNRKKKSIKFHFKTDEVTTIRFSGRINKNNTKIEANSPSPPVDCIWKK